MLPEFLSIRYVQYKEDTNKFLTWLVDTAKNFGYDKPVSISTPTNATPRLKGKARKESQKVASTPNKKGKEVRGKVSLEDILHLAKTIVTSTSPKNPVHVPQYILKRGRNAIDARRQLVAWFQTQAVDQPALQDDNDRHAHFIQILEEALNILTPYVTAPLKENAVPAPPVTSKTSEAQGKLFSNLFDNLEMDESEDDDLLGTTVIDVQDVATIEDAIQTQQQELYELESSEAEMQFAIFCTLEDAHSVQAFVVETWKNYKSGEIDLVTASLTTNTAINFVHGVEKQLTASYPQLTDYGEILDVFYPLAKTSNPRKMHIGPHDAQDVSTASKNGSTPIDFALDSGNNFDEIEYLYARPHELLAATRSMVKNSPLSFIRSCMAVGAAGLYDPRADRSQMSLGRKADEDSHVIQDVLLEGFLFTNIVMPAEDEFSQGMRQVFLKNARDPIPLWVVFALQIYLEIHHVLREHVDRGLKELRVARKQMKASLKEFFKNEKSFVDDGWPESGVRLVRDLDGILENCIERDVFSKEKEEIFSEPSTGPLDRPYHLLSQHPLLCGTLLLNIRLRLQGAGIPMVNSWGSIICGAHLYNAARQEGHLTTAWVDMEAFIAIHSPELIFVGKAPCSLGQYSNHFGLARGVSITAFSRDRRKSGTKTMSKQGPRQIEVESHVSKLLNNLPRLMEDLELGVQDVSRMLTTVSQKKKRSRAVASLLNQWNQIHKMTEVQVLAIVRQSLANEQPMLHFDYVAMHHRCRQLFRRLRSELGSDLDSDLTGKKIEDFSSSETMLPVVLSSILSRLERLNVGKNAETLVKVSGILKDVVEREGDEEMKKMDLKGKRHGWLANGT